MKIRTILENAKESELTLRRFNESDWLGYAGAERFNDNSNPFIGEIELTDQRETAVVVIADKNGLSLSVTYDFDESSYALDLNLLSQLNDKMDIDELSQVLKTADRLY